MLLLFDANKIKRKRRKRKERKRKERKRKEGKEKKEGIEGRKQKENSPDGDKLEVLLRQLLHHRKILLSLEVAGGDANGGLGDLGTDGGALLPQGEHPGVQGNAQPE